MEQNVSLDQGMVHISPLVVTISLDEMTQFVLSQPFPYSYEPLICVPLLVYQELGVRHRTQQIDTLFCLANLNMRALTIGVRIELVW